MTVTPQELADAAKANVELQTVAVAKEVTALVYAKLKDRVDSLYSGVQDHTPNVYQVVIPRKYFDSNPNKAGVSKALEDLQQDGFNVALILVPAIYDDEDHYFEFKV